ncbi:DUF1153 domain-containing protein [Novosphingobium sp. G106]|uniref:CtrA inhibitor SciP n=1 Tax=Novosphingobium sp. G106 TaxID=2849500 RepID=UPI001C2D67AC|nr:DUF1153 domain-containing protein [Novosphingobium sp. G106]MBV1691595.1 DUF1153 domain-containing protein [Novosphingobium sp. G106]
MLELTQIRPIAVMGPQGAPLTRHSLPALGERWTARRKADVVAAVQGGLLTVDEACDRYRMSVEELASWMRTEERLGVRGLRVTCVQRNREMWRADALN